jgi:hypothetical protein
MRDSGSAALDWTGLATISANIQNRNIEFEVTAPDDNPHTYYVAQFAVSGGGTVSALVPVRSRLSYEVFA